MQISLDRNATILFNGKVRVIIDTPNGAGGVKLSTTVGGVTFHQTGGFQMAYTLADDSKVQLKISYVTAKGNPAIIDGAVQWSSSNTEIATVQPVADPPADNSAIWLIAGATLGNCQITATADADLGEGVSELVTLLDVTVVGGAAVMGTIEPVGAAVPQAAAAKK